MSDVEDRYPGWLREALYDHAIADNVQPAAGALPHPWIRSSRDAGDEGQSLGTVPYAAYAMAVVGGQVAVARGLVENATGSVVQDGPDAGMLPRTVTSDGADARAGSHTPLLAWVTWFLHEREPDADFLARVYPTLAGWLDWWQSPRRDVDGDGLSEYAGVSRDAVAAESGQPSAPERSLLASDDVAPGPDGLVHEPIADVFLNASLHAELDALTRIAAVVDPERVEEWEDRRDQLAARMNELMWDEDVGGFHPVLRADVCAARPRTYHHTPALLQPLWSGVATQEQADRIVARFRETPRSYPVYDGIMRVVVADDRYRGHEVVTDALHPTSSTPAGGVEVGDGRVVLRFAPDTGPATAPYAHLSIDVDVEGGEAGGAVSITVEDGTGEIHTGTETTGEAGTATWTIQEARLWIHGDTFTRGLRSIEVATGEGHLTEVRLRYWRIDREGLLSRHGVKSAHPLDGVHAAPGAPDRAWAGPVWGPHNLHVCQGLRRYGYEALGRGVAMAYCDGAVASYLTTGAAMGHHDAATGRGIGADDHVWGGLPVAVIEEFLKIVP